MSTMDLCRATQDRLAELTLSIEQQAKPRLHDGLSIFVFHTAVQEDNSLVTINGRPIDQGIFDYPSLLTHFVEIAVAYEPTCTVYVVTNNHFDWESPLSNVQVLRLDLDAQIPIYERMVAMNAFVRSSLFTGCVAFLDSDALVNLPISPTFAYPFDVAFTFRSHPKLMPVNEGVIFAQSKNKNVIVNFFQACLGTFDRLIEGQNAWSEGFGEEYRNLKRWRGGQLSLNAVLSAPDLFHDAKSKTTNNPEFATLDTDTYNFQPFVGTDRLDAQELVSKRIVHLKGKSKKYLKDIRRIQLRILELRRSDPSLAQS